MGEIEEWARTLANEKREKREQKRLLDEKALKDRHLIDAKADQVWAELRDALNRRIAATNEAMGGEEVLRFTETSDPNCVSIKSGESGSELTVLAFDPESANMQTADSTYVLTTSGTNDVVWMAPDKKLPIASDALAKELVEKAFRTAE